MPPAAAITLPLARGRGRNLARVLQRCVHDSIIEQSPRWLMKSFVKPSPFLFLLPALALCVGAAALRAQGESGVDVVSGRVTDLTGKPVQDAQVVTTASASGLSRSATTDADGRYRIYFPQTSPEYFLVVKRMGFSPVQRTLRRHTQGGEQMTVDLQLGGTPLALSMVEVEGSSGEVARRDPSLASLEISVPNPVAEILARRDSLHLSAVQIVGLSDIGDTLQTKNSRIYKDIRKLLAKSAELGDPTQMAGTVAMMLQEASGNTSRAVGDAHKLLRPEQWESLPQSIRSRLESEVTAAPAKQQ